MVQNRRLICASVRLRRCNKLFVPFGEQKIWVYVRSGVFLALLTGGWVIS
jgi:hypothetical protein